MENGQLFKSKKGTPQGGNASPILANIYLHEFDLFIESLKTEYGTTAIMNSEYVGLKSKLTKAKKAVRESTRFNDQFYKDKVAKVNELDKASRSLPSRILENPNKAIFSYIRYADDWILRLKCSKAVAEEIYNRCESFFKTRLLLEWNKEKSILSRSTEKDVEFLGVELHFINKRAVKVLKMKTKSGRMFKQRTIQLNTMYYRVNPAILFARLREKGFVDKDNKPISYRKIINQDIIEIVKLYQSTMRGIRNYYSFVHNVHQLNYIHYVLFISLCKTLAHKAKTRKRQIMMKYGGSVLTFRYGKNQSKVITIASYGGYTRDLTAFNVKTVTEDRNPIPDWFVTRTSRWLNSGICGLCGEKGYTEMHHVKHIKKRGHKYLGFDKVLRAINRKQVPLCSNCHNKVHNGQYDGINVEKAAKQFYRNLGFDNWADREKGLTKTTIK